MLREGSLTTGTLKESLKRASELLRVLVYVAEPLRADGASIPSIERLIQDEFFSALCSQISTLEKALTQEGSSHYPPFQFTQEVILLARLLQFDLGFRNVWTPTTHSASIELSKSLFKLVLVRPSSAAFLHRPYVLFLQALWRR